MAIKDTVSIEPVYNDFGFEGFMIIWGEDVFEFLTQRGWDNRESLYQHCVDIIKEAEYIEWYESTRAPH